jgi:hypothetical protein
LGPLARRGILLQHRQDSRKARNLSGNPHCVVSTENAAEAVIVEGVAEELAKETSTPSGLVLFSAFWRRILPAAQLAGASLQGIKPPHRESIEIVVG